MAGNEKSGRNPTFHLSEAQLDQKIESYKQELKERIAELLGGRVAEAIVFGDISGGASNDIERATNIARKMVTQLGMSDVLGPVKYGTADSEVFLGRDFSSGNNFSEEISAKIDAEIKALIDYGYQTAKRVLEENRQKLDFVAEVLLKNELMDGDQFAAAMDRDDVTIAELEAMTEQKRARSKEENEARAKAEREAAEKAAREAALAADFSDSRFATNEFAMPTAGNGQQMPTEDTTDEKETGQDNSGQDPEV